MTLQEATQQVKDRTSWRNSSTNGLLEREDIVFIAGALSQTKSRHDEYYEQRSGANHGRKQSNFR